MKNVIIIFFLSLLTGCFPEDKLVTPLEIDIVEIPYSMYDSQIWYSLKNKSVTSHNAFPDWDLGFESTGSGHHIILNSSRFMYAGNTGSADFYGITSNTCDTMIFDDSGGDMNKTAIGNWANFTDPLNPAFQILTDPERSFTLFSFRNGGIIAPVQPINSDWDLCFTQYSTILYDDNNVATPYLVRGVYLNTAGTTAAVDSTSSFYDINAADLINFSFSPSQDVIGYSWKDYKNESYKINPDIFYIIKDQTDKYYKLKFTGYYNNSGARGYPSFQVIGLSK
jgi:hypothetical protein